MGFVTGRDEVTIKLRNIAGVAQVIQKTEVTEEEIIEAMKLTWKHLRVVMEPSSAVPLATLLKNKERFAGKRVGIIITGGNVDLDKLPWTKGV